jgi:hypothetical protein
VKSAPSHFKKIFFETCNLVKLSFMTLSLIEIQHQTAATCYKSTGDEMRTHYQRPECGKGHLGGFKEK